MRKILTCVIITVVAFSLLGMAAVSVQARGGDGFHSSIIQKLAERFNLNAEEVEKVFEEARDEIRQKMQARFEERAGGKMDKMFKFTPLTDEQKEALSTKREELREKCEELKDFSSEERRAKMEELKEEMEDFPRCGFWGSHRGFGRGFDW